MQSKPIVISINVSVHLAFKVNPKKTAFIATNKVTDKELQKLLRDDEPPVMRDLGIDHPAGRRRRMPAMKQRLNKAKHRRLKLRTLKIPALRVRLRLHRGGIQPVAQWGVESWPRDTARLFDKPWRNTLVTTRADSWIAPSTTAVTNTLIPGITSSSSTSKPCTS